MRFIVAAVLSCALIACANTESGATPKGTYPVQATTGSRIPTRLPAADTDASAPQRQSDDPGRTPR